MYVHFHLSETVSDRTKKNNKWPNGNDSSENQKYMHVGFAINVIQTAKTRKYTHIELTSCSS